MRPFSYQRAHDIGQAIQVQAATVGAQYLAGGTTLLDLAKLEVMQPTKLVDITGLQNRFGMIAADATGLKLGALTRMSDAENNAVIKNDYPVIAQSLMLAASPQLRNMATLGGNVLQRTRCNYFRDTSWQACNKRNPGSGCAAIGGVDRKLAILGTSQDCIATYPGDFAQSLIALDAMVDISGPDGMRAIRFEDLHVAPGTTPHIETTLRPAELITGFTVPAGPWTRRSLYLKIRDRASYDFALASAAVALEMEGPLVRQARIALGGVATKPWRAREAEAMLMGKTVDAKLARAAAEAAFAGARQDGESKFKPELGTRTLTRALLQAQAMEL